MKLVSELENHSLQDTCLVNQTLFDVMGRRPRILVVDDQPANVQALFKVFSEDHQVFMATSGEQAIAVCHEKLPDLVLLDIEMPDINGIEVCKLLKADVLTKNIPIIFVTAHDDESTEANGLAVGAVDFITKPIKREIVKARARTHLILKHQSDILRQWVYMDGLTGAYNRRYFNERFSSEFGRAFRHGGSLSVVFMDADFFKKYNDHYGHQMGDEALHLLSNACKSVLKRSADIVARYGGEEFVCLLPQTDSQGAYMVAKQMSQAVRDLQIEHVNSNSGILTISIGVATYHGGCNVNADGLLRLADENLYRSKSRGRNRISVMLAPWTTGIAISPDYKPPHIDRAEDYYGP